jgi:PAS domain S-box-containing protein
MAVIKDKTVLVIDDEKAIRQSFADYLEDKGFRVLIAENGRIGVDILDKETADLVLVDLRMPEMDGLEVMAHIAEKSPDTPLIAVSGTGVISDAVEALHQGAWDYLLKPVKDMSTLAHAVDMALEKARLKEENRRYQRHLEQMVVERTSELVQANENLSRNEQQFRTILDNIRAGIIIVDVASKRIVYTNPKTAEIAQAAIEEINGCLYHDILHPEQKDDDSVVDLDQDTDSSEHILKTHDGQEVPILQTSTRIHFKGKACLLVSFLDLSAQKAAMAEKEALQKQLRHVQRIEAIGTLAGGIAHDFNNILSVILGCTQLAIKEASQQQIDTRHMLQVQEAGNRAADLVQQILTISRKGELVKRPLRVSLIVKDVIKMLRATLPTTIDISHEIDNNSGMTLADPAQIHQIVMNLATNAAHAMRDTGGTLQLKLKNVNFDETAVYIDSTLAPGAYLMLTVSDTGHGMDAGTMERIFDPYYTTKSPDEGTGLGLAVVMGIVKGYKGAITVQSEPGYGTRFDLFFPRVDDDGKPEQPQSSSVSLPQGTETIILVDDEKLIGVIEREMLEKLGYQVHVESDSLELLRRFKENPDQFDLVISDVTMPKMPGDELARELLKICPDIPIILCSGFTTRITENDIKSMGVRDYLSKPIQLERLAMAVRRALDQ